MENAAQVGGAGPTLLGLFGLAVATLSTNIAANVVAPANAFVNLNPQRLTFRTGGLIAASLGAIICPWKLIGSTGGYIFVWLVGYSALLGPVVGIMLVDYFLVRRREKDHPLDTPITPPGSAKRRKAAPLPRGLQCAGMGCAFAGPDALPASTRRL
jgi:cytosine/uracil/thiamine/allantoin permease